MRQTVYWGIIWRHDEATNRSVVLDVECSGARRLRRRTYSPAPVTSLPPSEVTARDSSAVQLGTALATVAQDSAADQSALDSLHERSPDSLSPPRTNVAVRGEDVRKEAEDLFGGDANATFDIDVSNFAGNRRVLEYLEFFQLDARDRFEIWLSRLGRYEE